MAKARSHNRNKTALCTMFSKEIRSDHLARHMKTHTHSQGRVSGKFTKPHVKPLDVVPRPVKVVPRTVKVVPRPVKLVPRTVKVVPRPVEVVPRPVEIEN